MRCPRDRKTRMSEPEDYLNMCPHCGVEVFASRRAVNDIYRNIDDIWDYSLPLDKFLLQFSRGFRDLGLRAWERKMGVKDMANAMRDLKCSRKELKAKIISILDAPDLDDLP